MTAAQETSANHVQVGGDHYKNKPIQPWDYIVSNDLGFLAGNVVKYVSRYKDKNGVQDLEKAQHYLSKLIEVETAEKAARLARDQVSQYIFTPAQFSLNEVTHG